MSNYDLDMYTSYDCGYREGRREALEEIKALLKLKMIKTDSWGDEYTGAMNALDELEDSIDSLLATTNKEKT